MFLRLPVIVSTFTRKLTLILVVGERFLPSLYYRKLAGNISDVKILKKLLFDMNSPNYEKTKVVLNRGFLSAANINGLYKHHLKFFIAANLSLKLV